jgi:hypothetical protein|nr:MAG TPA: baseplate wedge protein [Caudoviricetes sp.]
MIISNDTTADKTYTIEEFISAKDSDEITYNEFAISKFLNGFELPVTSLLYDYEAEMASMAVRIKLSDLEFLKYRYKPFLFAYDVYGSTETEFIILMLNGIIDPKEFNFNVVKVIPKRNLISLLGRLHSVNDAYLNNIKTKKLDDIKNNTGNVIWTE